MTQRITIPMPPTLNRQTNAARAHRMSSARMKKAWTGGLSQKFRAELQPFAGEVTISFVWRVKTFGRDPDNVSAAAKYILDALVKAGILRNDNLNTIRSPYAHYFERGADDVEVVIKEVE